MSAEHLEILKESQIHVEIEGTDGTGKSTLANLLDELLLKAYPKKKIITLNEFSSTRLGQMITSVIKEGTFFSLATTGSNYPLSETLCLAGDYFARLEELQQEVDNSPDVILSDRGILTFKVYQEMRLSKMYPNSDKLFNRWINQIFSMVREPNTTIILTASEQDIRDRLIARGDMVTAESMGFIMAAQSKYIDLARNKNSFVVLENPNGKLEEVANRAVKIISEKMV